MISKEALIQKTYEDSERFRKFIDKSVNSNPTQAQKESENYKKAHISLWGLRIAIENPKGSFRSGIDEKGVTWSNKQHADYGYIKSTIANDGDHLDVYINKPLDYPMVFVVNQYHDDKLTKLDEHKCMVGYLNASSARKAYVRNFSINWRKYSKDLVAFTADQFKQWIKLDGALTKKAVNPFTRVYSIDHLVRKAKDGSKTYNVSNNAYKTQLIKDIKLKLPIAVLCAKADKDKVERFVHANLSIHGRKKIEVITALRKHESLVDLSY